MPETSRVPSRNIVYCIVPEDLADTLHESLRTHFTDDPGIEVVVEQRGRKRRVGVERRREAAPVAEDRRQIRSVQGRRVGERRAALVAVDGPTRLPRNARPFLDLLAFYERIEPSGQKLEDMDTARLVMRIQAGDRDAHATLYLRYFDRVYVYVRTVLRSSHDAEDATQEVFARTFAAIGRYERREQPFRAYLFTIARNVAIQQLRASGRMEATDPAELVLERDDANHREQVDFPALGWVTDRDLVMFIERLPLAQRQALVLRFMLDMTDKEIGELLDRTPADVRMLQSRAIRFLRARLAALGREGRADRRPAMRRTTRHAGVLRARRWALR